MTQEELEKKVRRLQDIEEIKTMHRNYIFCLSNSQWEEVIDCFAENATIEIRTFGAWKGKEQIARKIRDVIARRYREVSPKGGHVLIQPVITVEGDTAKGHWIMSHFVYELTVPARPVPQLARGRYECEYVREGGKWKFSYLKWITPWPEDTGYKDLYPIPDHEKTP